MKRAAEALGTSQPAVSMMVAELEQLLGAQLFLRHSRGVEPTRLTTELLPIARRIVAAVGDGSEIVSSELNASAGFVRIAATPAANAALLHPAVGRLATKFPKVHIEIVEISGAAPLQPLSDGLCDMLCLRKPEIIPETWQFEDCRSDDLVVICGAQHPLAKRKTASRKTLVQYRWLLTRRGSEARTRFEEIAEDLSIPAKNRCGIVTHVQMLTLELLTYQDHLVLLPRSVVEPWLRKGDVVELSSPATTPMANLGFLWQGDSARMVVRQLGEELLASYAPVRKARQIPDLAAMS
jgi:DNA-binding transcriptional LysR family regulator